MLDKSEKTCIPIVLVDWKRKCAYNMVDNLEREVAATTARRAPQRRAEAEAALASIPAYRHTTSGSRPVESSSSGLEQ